MFATYMRALEKRAGWARWAEEYVTKRMDHSKTPNYDHVMLFYKASLMHGDTLYMNKEFCALVDHARATAPDDLVFEDSWMQTPSGFMWLEIPFRVPRPAEFDDTRLLDQGIDVDPHLHAVSWFKQDGGYVFLTYQDWHDVHPNAEGFGCWSHFIMRPGDVLAERMKRFETTAFDPDAPGHGVYARSALNNSLHEMRWVFTAMHLMAQRLSMTVEHRASSMARDSARRKKLAITPFLKVVTLRRMEAERPAGGEHKQHDWQWKWVVLGHWRNQWYETDKTHKRIFIESYMKGPDDKPLKMPGHTLFKVLR
jgi:hypothetical protein